LIVRLKLYTSTRAHQVPIASMIITSIKERAMQIASFCVLITLTHVHSRDFADNEQSSQPWSQGESSKPEQSSNPQENSKPWQAPPTPLPWRAPAPTPQPWHEEESRPWQREQEFPWWRKQPWREQPKQSWREEKPKPWREQPKQPWREEKPKPWREQPKQPWYGGKSSSQDDGE
jgi:hypothetical protein